MTTAQFSLYPLKTRDLGPPLDAAVAAVRERGIAVEVGAVSSTISGGDEELFGALRSAFQAAAAYGDVVLVATVSNACNDGD